MPQVTPMQLNYLQLAAVTLFSSSASFPAKWLQQSVRVFGVSFCLELSRFIYNSEWQGEKKKKCC